MIKNRKLLDELEKDYLKKQKVDYLRNLKIYEEMHEKAREMGTLPSIELRKDLKWKIDFVRRLNTV